LPAAATGRLYEATIEARVPHAPPWWRVVGGRLPDGVSLDGETGRLFGWPRTEGAFRFTLEVRDGQDERGPRDVVVAAATRRFDLRVDRGPVAILPGFVPPMPYGQAVEHRFETAGGTPPIRFSVVGGRLPTGVVLTPEGTLAGAPTEAKNPYAVVVRATDAADGFAEAEFPLTVVLPPIAVATKSLPDAALAYPYDRTLSALPRGAGDPLAWRVVPGLGDLPPGLWLDGTGRFRGVTTSVGLFAFRVEVEDPIGDVASRDLSIRVNPGPVLEAVTPTTLPPATSSDPRVVLAGQGFQPGMTATFGIAAPIDVDVVDATTARVTPPTPPLAPVQSGVVAVSIANPDGGTHTKTAAFRYPLATVEFVAQGVKGTARGGSRGVAAGDLDGDGFSEVVHVGGSGIEILRCGHSANGAYANTWTSKVVRSDGSFDDVALADVDADGDLDLVVTRSATSQESVEVYKNDGKSAFPSSASVVTPYAKPPSHHNPHSLAVGDVDGDGVPDVAFTSSRGNQGVVYVFRGLGNGSFVEVHSTLDDVWSSEGGLWGANAVALGDLDGDGRDDLVVTDTFPCACAPGSSCPSTPSTNLHPGADVFAAWTALCGPGGVPGAWHPVKTTATYARLDGDNEGVALYDHDGDGLFDVAVFGGFQDVRGQGVGFFRGDGTGALVERFVQPTAYDRRFGARLDANLDAADDLIVVGGDGSSLTPYGTDKSVAECYVGGGLLPVRAWRSGPEDQAGGSIPNSNPGRVCVGDFDGDGLDDFAVDQSFLVKERSSNDQGAGLVEGVAIYLNRSR
jgi:hypothetical protein